MLHKYSEWVGGFLRWCQLLLWWTAGPHPHYLVQSSGPLTISRRGLYQKAALKEAERKLLTVNKTSHKPCGCFSDTSFPVWLQISCGLSVPCESGGQNVKTKPWKSGRVLTEEKRLRVQRVQLCKTFCRPIIIIIVIKPDSEKKYLRWFQVLFSAWETTQEEPVIQDRNGLKWHLPASTEPCWSTAQLMRCVDTQHPLRSHYICCNCHFMDPHIHPQTQKLSDLSADETVLFCYNKSFFFMQSFFCLLHIQFFVKKFKIKQKRVKTDTK